MGRPLLWDTLRRQAQIYYQKVDGSQGRYFVGNVLLKRKHLGQRGGAKRGEAYLINLSGNLSIAGRKIHSGVCPFG